MILRKFIGKFVICFSLFVVAFQTASAQEKPLTLNDILVKLTFTSRISKTAKQINGELIKQINERKVGFGLTKHDEQEIKKRGGNLALIKAIKANFLETRSPEIIEQETLYKKFIGCHQKTDLESRKLCLGIAKEIVQKWENIHGDETQINYFRGYISHIEKLIQKSLEHSDSNPKKDE